MNYNPETDLWVDTDGLSFIKNEFDPSNPCFIEMSYDVWKAVWKGQTYSINWSDISLPTNIISPIKEITENKLKAGRVAATHLGEVNQLLFKLLSSWPIDCDSYLSFGLNEFTAVWGGLASHSKSTFRKLFTEIAETGKFGADGNLAIRIKKWKARSNIKTLRSVLEWNPESGSLTSAELELLRAEVIESPENESDKDHAVRILCWAMIELMKRTQQFLSIKADGFKLIENNGITEYFFEVPKAKAQTGEPPDLWTISAALANEILLFSARPEVRELQSKHNRLLVWESKGLNVDDQVSSGNAGSAVRDYVRSLNIISPRTKDRLHVTPYRLRHTGVTRMAAQGVSRDVIQHILEHDDSFSAQAYIDAIGSDLVPAIERADRNLGDLFKELNEVFFKGKVVPELTKAKVFIPIFNANPMPVGSCGMDTLKKGECKKQPFIACYNGCKDFLAWEEADHIKALTYVENELERWSQAEGHNARSKAIKDFEQLHHAIIEVIRKIQGGESDAVA